LGKKNKVKVWSSLTTVYVPVRRIWKRRKREVQCTWNLDGDWVPFSHRRLTVVVFSLISEQQHGTRLLRVIWLFSFFFLWTWPPHVFSTLYYTGWDRCKSSLKALSSQAEPSPRRSSSSSNTHTQSRDKETPVP
jgi:hypothetical protein